MFRNLCSKNNYFSNQDISHVLMDGGVLSVPFDRLDDFYKDCIQCIKNDEKIFVVEQKTKNYNFFLDIDYKDDVPLSPDEILDIASTIFLKVKQFCDSDQKLIISISKPKKKDQKIKTGIHANFPGMVVNQKGAINLMYHIIHELCSVYPDKDWFQFIDPSVYGSLERGTKGSGFRMPWSHKKSKHVECGGNGCPECNHTGKLTEGEYLPIFYLNRTSKIELDQEPTIELLKLVTLRTLETKCIEIPEVIKQIDEKKKKKEGGFTKAQTKNELFDSELNAYLETFIRKFMKGQENARLTKIFKNNKSFYIQTTSKFCENLNRSHSSNHIWFLVDSKTQTICQKCFCRCETTEGRRHGFCKDFSGRSHKLTPKICEIMFPNTKKKS